MKNYTGTAKRAMWYTVRVSTVRQKNNGRA